MNFYQITKDESDLLFLNNLKNDNNCKKEVSIDYILELSKSISLIENGENKENSDSKYVILAELIVDFLCKEKSNLNPFYSVSTLTLSDKAKSEILSTLNLLKDTNRNIYKTFDNDDLALEFKEHIDELIKDIETVKTSDNKKEERMDKKSSFMKRTKLKPLFLLFSFIFTALSLYILSYSVVVIYESLSLKIYGEKASATVLDISSQMYATKSDGDKDRLVYQYFEILKFETKDGKEVYSRLNTKSENDIKYKINEKVDILYNKDAPAQIIEANSNSQLIKGLVAFVLSLFIFFSINFISHDLFLKNGKTNKLLSYGSKAIILVLAIAFLFYQNLYSLYRYLPNENIDKLTLKDNIFYEKSSEKPFSGRVLENKGDLVFILGLKDGVKDGLSITYLNGAIKDITYYKNGKKDGLNISYTKTGVLVDVSHYKDGLLHGRFQRFSKITGKINFEGYYVNNKLDGVVREFFEDSGNLFTQRTYDHGVLNGNVKEFYKNGMTKIDMNYKDNVANGPYKYYYESGQLQIDTILKDGKYSSDLKVYSIDGKLIDLDKKEKLLEEKALKSN